MRVPVYTVRSINRKNATYSRIVPHLEPHFELFFTECTPKIAKDSKQKFETDLDWVNRALYYRPWSAVLAFSSQAHKALEDLGYEPFAKLPHPVSYKWRKQLIIDSKDLLLRSLSEQTAQQEGDK